MYVQELQNYVANITIELRYKRCVKLALGIYVIKPCKQEQKVT